VPTRVAAKLQQAVAHHKSGQLEQAERMYREILALVPTDVYALYLLGAVKYQKGEHQVAVELLQAATRVNPNYAAPYACLGLALRELKNLEDALASFDRALVLRPDDAEVLNNRGNALLEVARHEEALASYERALALKPAFVTALVGRGIALLRLGRPGDALPPVDRALALKNEDTLALNARGNALVDLKRPAEALASLDQALSLKPDFAEALSNRGNALLDLKRPEEALASLDRALVLKPDFVEALVNRGNALRKLRRPEEALASYDRALMLKPDFVEAISNRGNALRDLKRLDEALASYVRALALKPDYANAHVNEGLTRLLAGDFQRGWRKHEWRWQTDEGKDSKRDFKQPMWLGEPSVDGKSILLHAEQGFGDTLQFCRYARLVTAQGATVLMEVQPALKSLLARLEGVSRLLAYGEPLPAFDFHCPLLSLPLAFNTTKASIPAKIPYLSADPARVGEWGRRLGDKRLPRIGIVWSGRTEHRNDHNRSIPLANFAKLVSSDAEFISLQKEVRAADDSVLNAYQHIRHIGDQLNEFADTAAIVELLDVVITVDTAVAHLAGALGIPVWILLPFNPDWRWLLDRGDSPWYPTARLFRQPAVGDWDSVIERIAIELRERYLTRADQRPLPA
jgi:tetratricopeptide (TPR) repeat protein